MRTAGGQRKRVSPRFLILRDSQKWLRCQKVGKTAQVDTVWHTWYFFLNNRWCCLTLEMHCNQMMNTEAEFLALGGVVHLVYHCPNCKSRLRNFSLDVRVNGIICVAEWKSDERDTVILLLWQRFLGSQHYCWLAYSDRSVCHVVFCG